ncbi:MAG: hypothetical protein M1833_005272 [Piccolia ochrophora]|nr:MAG: hypothetical protein M1833_005272 [Piccolia ochrophora]
MEYFCVSEFVEITSQEPFQESRMTIALIVVDMQDFFAGMTETAMPQIVKLVNHFKSRSLPCIFTQHGHTNEELTPPFHNQLVRKWGPSGSIARGSQDWELIPEIKSLAEGSRIVAKNTYDAFINTDLEKVLRDQNVDTVAVCGVMTDCCCDTTARSAFNRGFETWLVEDACGTATQKQHKAGINGFGFAFGDVMQTSQLLQRLG